MWRLSRVAFRSPCHAPYRLPEPLPASVGETWTRMTGLVPDAPFGLRNIRLVSSGLRDSTSASPSAAKANLTPPDTNAGKPPVEPPQKSPDSRAGKPLDASNYGSSISTPSGEINTTNSVRGSSRVSSSSSSGGEVFDVAIVGGGLIGAAAACALSTSRLTRDLRIALIDALPLCQAPRHASHSSSSSTPTTAATQKISAPDARVIAVNPSSIDLLKRVGVWDDIASDTVRAAPFQHMQVWDFAGPGFIRFNASESHLPYLGYIVENKLIVSSLLRRIQDHTSVSFIAPIKLQTINWPKPSDSSINDTPNKGGSTNADGDGDGFAGIHYESRPPIRARLVIGADGSRSRVRSLAHLRTIGWPYHQRGVIATVDLASPSITAWQRFLPSGPLALLPLGDRYSNVVWSTTEEHALKLQSMSPEEFAHAVNEAFSKEFPAPGFPQGGLKLPSVLPSAASVAGAAAGAAAAATAAAAAGAVSSAAAAAGKSLISAIASAASLESLVAQSPMNPSYRSSDSGKFCTPPEVLAARSKVLSFPLSLQHAGSYVAPRCALVGDAAHTVHPLAGQGANLGFGDVTALVTVLEKLVEVGEDIGEVQLLRSFERERMGANIAMMGAMDSLKRLFATNTFPLANARSIGLSILNASPLAKEKFAAFASGTIL